MLPAPVDLQVIGRELAIRWNDGAESFFPLEALRRACPCATCAGEPDVLGRVAQPAAPDETTPAGGRLRSWEMIGGYAWQPTWEDGHATGLYSFGYLRQLSAAPPVS